MQRVIRWLGCQEQPVWFQMIMAWVVVLHSAGCLIMAAVAVILAHYLIWLVPIALVWGALAVVLVRWGCLRHEKAWIELKKLKST